jgi:hypothetical protein
MVDLFPKFIIETDEELGDCLIISKCTYHRDLAVNYDMVKGGGLFDFKNDEFILYGKSDQFGEANFVDIANCIKNDKVFTNPFMTHSIAKKYKFAYKNSIGEIYDFFNLNK